MQSLVSSLYNQSNEWEGVLSLQSSVSLVSVARIELCVVLLDPWFPSSWTQFLIGTESGVCMTYLWLGLCPSIARELLEMAYVCLNIFVYFIPYWLPLRTQFLIGREFGVWMLSLSLAWIVFWRAARVDMFSWTLCGFLGLLPLLPPSLWLGLCAGELLEMFCWTFLGLVTTLFTSTENTVLDRKGVWALKPSSRLETVAKEPVEHGVVF